MARAATKGRKRPQPDARAQQRRGGRGRNLSATEQTLFFSRLRRSAKWAYVFLAVAFALTFAFVGVGSGDNGALSNLFDNVFRGGSGGTSISKAQKEIAKNPRNAKAYLDLATAFQAKNQTTDAITALQQYTALKPKDADALGRLGGLQLQNAYTLSQQANSVSQQQQQGSAGAAFGPSSTSTLAKALGTDPIQSAVTSAYNTQSSNVYGQMQAAYAGAVGTYQKLEKLQPNSPDVVRNLAQAADQGQQTPVAIAAYKRYLKLAPAASDAPQVRARIKQLQPAPVKPVKKKPKHKSG